MTYLLLILTFFASAHEQLDSMDCKNPKAQLTITKTAKGYQAQLSQPKKDFFFKNFSVSDQMKNNQIFDVYKIKNKELDLVVSRPETKGPVKDIVAQLNNMTFTCSKRKN